MVFILHIVPVSFTADPKLVRNSALLLSEPLDIQVVTREAESGKSAQKMVRDILLEVRRKSRFDPVIRPARVVSEHANYGL